jgi:oligopeptide transport system substrate-binding protein
MYWRSVARHALAVMLLAAACQSGSSATQGGAEQLAAEQTLRFPIISDIAAADPAEISATAEMDIFHNVFSGLYKFDDALNEVPDIAAGKPDVSADGLTYTFHLRRDVRFSNADPVRADDFIYSWNRAAAARFDYASIFEPVQGYAEVAAGKTKTLNGLSKDDDYTLKATLSKPAGYWLTELGLWAAWVVDQKVIASAGDDRWYTAPDTLVGTGPFKMSAHEPNVSIDFVPVPNWYGGSTGKLTRVHIDIVGDQGSQVLKYESGGFDVVGYAGQSPTPEDILRYRQDPRRSRELTLQPTARTTWVGFGFKTGPFAGLEAGRDGRKAFSLAIDRRQLVDIACAKGTTCIEATGGVITKGLRGYQGDGSDANAKFDPGQARALYRKWDPNGGKVAGLTYAYNVNALNRAVAENLQAQWRSTLNVSVELEPAERITFNQKRGACTYGAFRNNFLADYDHPQDWFEVMFVTGAVGSGSCYNNPRLDSLVRQANQKPLLQAMPDYDRAARILMDDVAYGNLFYSTQPYLVHGYVKGAGGSALYDHYWSEIRLLKH